MDFGDILNQWDESQKKASKKTAKNPEKQVQSVKSSKKANSPAVEQYFAELEAKKQAELDAKDPSKKKKTPPKQEKPSITGEQMTAWLNHYGVVDKDKAVERYKENQKLNSLEYLKNMPPDATLDLHGLTRDDAWNHMEIFTSDCVRRKFTKIMFVHGKGIHSGKSDPVLGELVRLFIEKNPHLGKSGHPGREAGGSGATWVLLK